MKTAGLISTSWLNLELPCTVDTLTWRYFFIVFNPKYQNRSNYGLWDELKLATLVEEDKQRFEVDLSEHPSMILNHLNKRIKDIPSIHLVSALMQCYSFL